MTPRRFASVDALRGAAVAAMLLVNHPGDWGHVYAPLLHAAWHGCTPTDLVFPTFLFIVGVSSALALGPRRDAGAAPGPLRSAVMARGLRIVLLGLLLHALAWWLLQRPEFRVMGVLQRIGICFVAVGLAAVQLRPRGQWALLVGLLAGYGALLQWGGGGLDKPGNLAQRLDTAVLGRFAYEWDPATGVAFDPEGLLSTLGALATTLLGLVCGALLRRGEARGLLLTGMAAALVGWWWSGWLPFNKALWTPSFALWTGGLAAVALAVAHGWIDHLGHRPWGRAFGVNAMAAFAGAWTSSVLLAASGVSGPLYRTVFGPVGVWWGPEAQSLAYALAFVAVWAGIVRVMDRRGWHWKV
ncbi:acyltransferase family protein [Roseateles cellulosilyticus]|uniref:Heparan-alpha-glucosaminide N-acetyltransferase domain-containing protein n=1 Tax=Pelomonas cellulosilytica TaxID=2906762 RepID=A0ABS8Y2E1_9BURK|nr:heparan-alpha-glucosaminide N-acetyltransferase domain-containing protein [Pelomonas sp. P8]MCE4558200.1 heparan-alpha-glucosaminide N-acetyltransferase domain-containing protein [Pelomonas sp. P8]